MKGEIEELVSADGSMTNSKIPILDPRLHPKKTMDQTVAASRITNDPISRGYRTYYGESVEEMSEEDMSAAFGYAETSGKTGPETYEYYKDELEMEPDEVKEIKNQSSRMTLTLFQDKFFPKYKNKKQSKCLRICWQKRRVHLMQI
jgi:hypothetical protein